VFDKNQNRINETISPQWNSVLLYLLERNAFAVGTKETLLLPLVELSLSVLSTSSSSSRRA
jgi:hypothetical protein